MKLGKFVTMWRFFHAPEVCEFFLHSIKKLRGLQTLFMFNGKGMVMLKIL